MAIVAVKENIVEYTDYESQEGALPLSVWMDLYNKSHGVTLNPGTVRKRRLVSGLGKIVPPKVYLLTKWEFEEVLDTPLPMCNKVVRKFSEKESDSDYGFDQSEDEDQ